ncbi:Hypothetical protein NTJ_14801 [Nesidiocoris tenuis]|uniref:Uncharacterized protein n=1 Tax=Nesidiocoris tenuis TaxID=355587 RepID=A0ABN7BC88_9HEMI|nr:Hypothetical protein NTJ_14801 [Nesidiocoris tenuis]
MADTHSSIQNFPSSVEKRSGEIRQRSGAGSFGTGKIAMAAGPSIDFPNPTQLPSVGLSTDPRLPQFSRLGCPRGTSEFPDGLASTFKSPSLGT